jgi:CheY-like chemotaxis protein
MHGHDVAIVHDGDAALTAIRARSPDIAVLDIGMPGLNGYEVARRLRADENTASLYLVAVTGWGQAADRQAASDAGFDRHLVKPLEPQTLLDVLAALPPRGAPAPAGADHDLAERRP